MKLSPVVGLTLAVIPCLYYLPTARHAAIRVSSDLRDAPNDIPSSDLNSSAAQSLIDTAHQESEAAAAAHKSTVSSPSERPASCPDGAQSARSDELQKLSNEDQADRQGSFDSIDWSVVGPRDKARRARVAAIAAEGCLAGARDYAAAALVYQHGDTADDYFHAFTYFKKAVDLGDASQKPMLAKGADRYLVSLGYKQLFATQASRPSMSPSDCWCLQPVAQGMTEEARAQYAERTLKEAFAWVDALNDQLPQCRPAKYCATELKEPPKGALPGLW